MSSGVNIPVKWQRHIRKTANALQDLIPNLRLFVALKGLGNLRRKWQKQLIATLRYHGDMLCSDFSQDADLLLDAVTGAYPKRPRLSQPHDQASECISKVNSVVCGLVLTTSLYSAICCGVPLGSWTHARSS